MKNQPFKRTDRISDLLRKIISEVVSQRIHNWGIEGLTITHIDVSPDIKHAQAYYRVLDETTKDKVKSNLYKAMPLIQKEVGRLMRTKFTPHIHFRYDESLDYGDHIFDLLEKAKPSSDEE